MSFLQTLLIAYLIFIFITMIWMAYEAHRAPVYPYKEEEDGSYRPDQSNETEESPEAPTESSGTK